MGSRKPADSAHGYLEEERRVKRVMKMNTPPSPKIPTPREDSKKGPPLPFGDGGHVFTETKCDCALCGDWMPAVNRLPDETPTEEESLSDVLKQNAPSSVRPPPGAQPVTINNSKGE